MSEALTESTDAVAATALVDDVTVDTDISDPRRPLWAAAVRTGRSGRSLTRLEKLVLLVVAAYPSGASVPEVAHGALTGERSARQVLRALGRDGLVVAQLVDSEQERWLIAPPDWDGGAVDDIDDNDRVDPTPAALAEGLVGEQGVLEGFLDDFPDDPTTAYRFALAAARQLGEDFAPVSKDLHGYLRNAVIARAVEDAGHEMPSRDLGRLCREAKVLGTDGGGWIVAALFATASADITGNVASYVIRAARSMSANARARDLEDTP